MTETTQQQDQTFDTEHFYAIFSGWLIIPAISTLLTFFGSIIMLIFVNPFELSGFDVYVYSMDVFFLPFLIVIYYFWIKRKRIFPKLMIAYFAINGLWAIVYFIAGFGINFFNIAMSILWIIYFLKSERVNQTFIR